MLTVFIISLMGHVVATGVVDKRETSWHLNRSFSLLDTHTCTVAWSVTVYDGLAWLLQKEGLSEVRSKLQLL